MSSPFVILNASDHPNILKTDVLIIGAGPSGLMAAQALGRLGIDVTVIERRAPGEAYGNADGLQPRTLEIWQGYGMLETIAAKGTRMIAMVGYERSKSTGCLVRSQPSSNVVVSSRYPYEITASISDIEATLRESAEKAHVKFIHSSWPVSLEIDESKSHDKCTADEFPVKVTVETACSAGEDNRHRTISSKYVVGADGAYSWVRRALDITMDGEQTEDVWGVVDVIMKTDFPDYRFKCIIQGSAGPVVIIPREGDKVRIYISMAASDHISRRDDGRLDKSTFDHREIQRKILERIKERLAPFFVEFTHVFWSTIFSTAQKVASKFSFKNRVFIAGDACHTHSPKAGQGANASMGDSHNLAWKLAYVLRHWASPSILETYEDERRAYALELISFDKVISTSLEGGTAADYQRILHKQNLFTSGTGISYSSSNLTVQINPPRSSGSVGAGERFPFGPLVRLADWHPFDSQDLVPSDGKFKLILLPGNLLHTESKEILHRFCRTFQNAMLKRVDNLLGDLSGVRSRLSICTIARNLKEDITWKDVPPKLVESWKCCFTTDSLGENDDFYEKFGVYQDDQTAMVLVRPDGYISMIAGLDYPEIAELVLSYLYTL
ncbi:hypothetical protein BDN70DRAFT_993405 [Pholiota conissans]|uniref:FAD binding domain-containing protein n=1 Tax=Pholiota conissans TaxID=109636 RepID=A0A9P6CUF3_9AGAR|nr:hypothetical protein BDN70DRAFT_993405 [Pholiota conissans]